MQINKKNDKNEVARNHMNVFIDARTKNESLARMVVACFLTEMNPTIEEVSDVKTAVSEAVTNAIIHGYEATEAKAMPHEREATDANAMSCGCKAAEAKAMPHEREATGANAMSCGCKTTEAKAIPHECEATEAKAIPHECEATEAKAIPHGCEAAETKAMPHECEAADTNTKTTETKSNQVELICDREGKKLTLQIIDHGVGIPDINKAKEPFFTTKPEQNRSGMGFAFMEAFMDGLEIESEVGKGTKITMKKYIGRSVER